MAKKKKIKEIVKSNTFDKIIKKNITESILPLVNELLHQNITMEQLSELTESPKSTIEREPDVLRLVKFEDKRKNFILHIEFQSFNNNEIHFRMIADFFDYKIEYVKYIPTDENIIS